MLFYFLGFELIEDFQLKIEDLRNSYVRFRIVLVYEFMILIYIIY
jgi:hypothetical protein